jgi:hypothetical protein
MCKSRLWRWAALFTGALLGTWNEACIPETLRDEWRAQVGHLSPREHNEGNLKGAPLLGTLKDMLNKALEIGVCFQTGANFGEHKGMLLYLRLLREGEKFYI